MYTTCTTYIIVSLWQTSTDNGTFTKTRRESAEDCRAGNKQRIVPLFYG